MIHYAILLMLVVDYVRPGSYVPQLSLLHSIVPLGTVVGGLVFKSRVPYSRLFLESNTLLILSFLALVALSVLTAEVTMTAYNVFTAVLGYCLLYLLVARHVNTVDRIRGVFKALVFIHLLLAALTPELFTDPDTRHYLKSGVFLGDGNDYALSVNLAIPMCLFLMFEARSVVARGWYLLLVLALVACVVVTQSRGGTIALSAVGLYYWVKSDRKLVTGFMAAIVVAGVLIAAPPAYFARLNTIESYETDGSAQGRINAWRAGAAMALAHPLLGVSAGHFPENFQRFKPPDDDTAAWKTAHSIYFLTLGELGFPGLGVLLWILVSNFTASRRLGKGLKATAGHLNGTHVRLLSSLSVSLAAYAIAGAFLSATYYPHMFLLAGLMTSARRLARECLESTPAQPRAMAVAGLPGTAPRLVKPSGIAVHPAGAAVGSMQRSGRSL
ncbi:MAG: O-antigen ligase family protein [Acidobacteria bacterium]|nr:O-antigen ligase family protein [Acidobacteriota bacterium]